MDRASNNFTFEAHFFERKTLCLQTERKYMSEAARAAMAMCPSDVKNMWRMADQTEAMAVMAAVLFWKLMME